MYARTKAPLSPTATTQLPPTTPTPLKVGDCGELDDILPDLEEIIDRGNTKSRQKLQQETRAALGNSLKLEQASAPEPLPVSKDAPFPPCCTSPPHF